MLTTIRMDVTEVKDDLMNMLDDLSSRILFMAADAGGEVIQNTYHAELLRRATVSGTYKSAQGTIEHFIQAYESVARRTLMFKDGQGAYSVVGIAAAAGNWRLQSPQALWLEEGTVDREHESGHPTGRVEAEHVLAGIADTIGDVVVNTMQNIIIEQLEHYVT